MDGKLDENDRLIGILVAFPQPDSDERGIVVDVCHQLNLRRFLVFVELVDA